MSNVNINIPQNVKLIIDTLEDAGYEAFAVGGCVRDALMGRVPNDWDITTSATPMQVKELFRRTIDTGIKHGTVTIMLGKEGYEVTTYRIDGDYMDGRHPDKVIFTNNLIEDLKRRDFTINAMAYNERVGIVDAFDGINDLENKIIRCVGEATERFTEDALRILRALRFSAQLDFNINEATAVAVKELGKNLGLISKERIQTELDKLITSNCPDRIKLVHLYGLNKFIFEGATTINEDHLSLYENISSIMESLPNNHYLRWAALMHYEAEPSVVLRKLKFDNVTINTCSKLVSAAHTPLPDNKPALRRMIVKYGKDIFDNYLFTYIHSLCATGLYDHGSSDHVTLVEKLYKEIISDNDCISTKDMAIGGTVLLKEGIESGKKMGDVINYLFERVLDEPSLNEYDTLLSIAKNYYISLQPHE
ncbi:MAG: CCA tRNA nucleotidyltransferase [Lachnospiraceae bacterium]|nr:CCA tRNA nucleotidyltransferase [Lachnospiraceae bacterium]